MNFTFLNSDELVFGHFLNERLSNRTLSVVVLDDSLLKHISLKDSHALVQVQLLGVNVKGILRFVIISRNSSEVRDNSSTGFLVQSFRISLLAGFERRADIDLSKALVSIFVSCSSLSSGSSLR